MNMKEHLKSRHMDPVKYNVQVNEEANEATFLLWNESGKLVGYQLYRPHLPKDGKNGRYFTYRVRDPNVKNSHELAVFGTEFLNRSKNLMFVVEGIFDCVRLLELGLPAVAVLANDPKQLKPWLRASGKKVVAVCDNDENNAGLKLAKVADEVVLCPKGKDLGDMTDEQVKELMKEFL